MVVITLGKGSSVVVTSYKVPMMVGNILNWLLPHINVL